MGRGSLLLIVLISFVGFFSSAQGAEPVESCQCQDSSCGPCEVETGTSFYSAKCGPGLSQVKSCKKPTCEPVENQKACLALFKKENASAESTKLGARTPASEDGNNTEGGSRAPAKAPAQSVGEIADLVGSGKVTRVTGSKDSARKNLALFEGDVVETMSDGKIRIALKDDGDPKTGSELILTPNSRMRLETVRAESAKGPRDVTLKLLMGKLRSRVSKKSASLDPTFRVITRSAVAGVRGTDFVTSFEFGDKEWVTEVRTFTGKVELGSVVKPADGTRSKTIDVTEGTYAAFVVPAPPKGADEKMIEEAISTSGELTPLLLMKPEDSKLLDEATDLKPVELGRVEQASKSREVANGQSDFVCQEPAAQFNQCSWTCEGKNPKGEKSCRTDLPEVSCVRRLCRANGQWAEPKRLPASQSEACVPGKTVVRDCGAYW